jgi:hypothetical protein
VAQAITRLYGVPSTNITSTTFSDLKLFLSNAPGAPDLLPAFDRALWVVVAMQTIDAAVPASDAARQLLALRPDLLNGKRVIGLVFGPPHSLTAAELARFTAVYALYGKRRPLSKWPCAPPAARPRPTAARPSACPRWATTSRARPNRSRRRIFNWPWAMK